jgi:hypothetical protein
MSEKIVDKSFLNGIFAGIFIPCPCRNTIGDILGCHFLIHSISVFSAMSIVCRGELPDTEFSSIFYRVYDNIILKVMIIKILF